MKRTPLLSAGLTLLALLATSGITQAQDSHHRSLISDTHLSQHPYHHSDRRLTHRHVSGRHGGRHRVVRGSYGGVPVVRTSSPGLLLQPQQVNLGTTVHFAFDRSNLRQSDRAELSGLAAQMGSLNQVSEVQVVGHTDSIDTVSYNQGLSERRAVSTATYLSQQGVPRSQIAIAGRSELQPVASNRTRRGRALNRRAEVAVRGYNLVQPPHVVYYPTTGVIRRGN